AKGEQYRITSETCVEKIADEVNENFTFTFVIKPNREGSTVGLSIVKNKQETEKAIKKANESDEFILVEQFIDGMELTVPVLGKMNEERALPIIEIVPKNEIYDYESKYTAGGSEHVVPARISESLTKEIKEHAVNAHRVL